MVSLKLLSTVNIQLIQAKNKTNNNIRVLVGLVFVIMIGDFYQLSSIAERLLWGKVVTSNENYYKKIWNHFTSVITLTKQMQKRNNKSFQVILIRARKSWLNIDNIVILNSKFALILHIYNLNKNIVIVQQNVTRYTINWL